MRNALLSLFLLGTLLSHAQQSDSSSVEPGRKNLFFFNLLPVLVPAVGAIPEQFAVRIGYERSLNRSLSLRFVPCFIARNLSYNSNYYNVLFWNDTLMEREYITETATPEFRFGLGLKKSWEREMITWYAGVDFYASFSHNQLLSTSSFWKHDTDAVTVTGAETWLPLTGEPVITRWMETKNHDFGISPFFGAEKKLGKRFSLSAQFGFDFFIRDTYLKRIYPQDVDLHFYSYNFNMAGLINELAIRYRF